VDKTCHFRQNSTFLYYFVIQQPALTAVIEIDNDLEIVLSDEYLIEDFVWRGLEPTIILQSSKCGENGSN
jgi:Xaa-Pro aminopeptidase